MRNLVDNAARYSPAGSSVRVELASVAGATRLAVCDEGPGIAPALRERVFESYYRIPGAPGDGSGLGLAIVREIACSTMRAWKSTRATAVAARASTSCSVLDNAPVDQLDHAVALSGEGVVVRHE